MPNSWKIQNGYGFSWGIRGLRIGKNQYGNWWVSVSLPLGFRVIKYFRFDRNITSPQIPSTNLNNSLPNHLNRVLITQHLTENQKILERIKQQKS